MRKNSAQTGQIVDFIYAKTDSAATGNLISSPSAHNISDTEVQIVDSKSPTLAYTSTADAIQIVQGTPNSKALYNVDPFGTGYPDVEKSGILKKGNVLSVSKYEYADPTYQVVQLEGLTGMAASTNYQLVATMTSTRGDITYGMNREVFSVSYTGTTSTPTDAQLIQHFVTELNKESKIIGNVSNTQGTKPFIALALAPAEASDTIATEGLIPGLDIGDDFAVGTYNGVEVRLTVDEVMYHTLIKACVADNDLCDGAYANNDTDHYKIVSSTTANANVDRMLIIALDETPVLAFDDIMEVKTRIDFGINDLTYTKTELVEPFEGTGLGRQVLLWYRSKAKLQKFNMQNHPIHGEFFINQDLPEYFTTDGKYSLTIIDYIDTVDTINGTSTHPKQVVIVHDAASAKGDAADTINAGIADGGLDVTTTITANFENALTTWIAASNSVKTIDFLGSATVSEVTFGS